MLEKSAQILHKVEMYKKNNVVLVATKINFLKLIFQNAVVMYKAWKVKQVKPRKPEDFDDTESRAVYDAYKARQHFTSTVADL